MSVYYCHNCGVRLGYMEDYTTDDLLGNTYQLGKYIKHTSPSTAYEVQSVFLSGSTQAYGRYIVDAKQAGSVEIDDRNRRNIIYVAGENCGFLYEYGNLVRPQNSIKVVLSSDTAKIHAYPESSTSFSTGKCSECGIPIIL